MKRWALIALATIVFLLLVTGCMGHNTAGKGNHFELFATVEKVGDRSITVSIYRVTYTAGKADGWFEKGTNHQIHNNYNTCGWHTIHTVGRVYAGTKKRGIRRISIDDLRPGDFVMVEGRIRSNAHVCGKGENWNSRPVYDQIYLSERPSYGMP